MRALTPSRRVPGPFSGDSVARLLPLVALLLVGCGGSIPGPTVDFGSVAPAPATYTDSDLNHLQFVLSDEQQEEYRALTPAARGEFMREVWASLDPTPTSAYNEREMDHYRKLTVARTEFGREKDPGWDKRGELLLRYGAPDARQKISGDVVPGLGLVPPQEIWIYQWLGQAYRLEDPRFQRDFVDALSRRTGRPDIGREVAGYRDQDGANAANPNSYGADDIANLGADADTGPNFNTGRMKLVDAEAQLAQERMQSMLVRGQEGLRERPRAYLHDYGGGKLDYFFEVNNFSDSGSGRTRVEINTGFWATDLQFMPDGTDYVAVISSEAVLKTADYRQVERVTKRTLDRRSSVENLRGRLVLDQITMIADPGNYRLALVVRDSVSGNVGIFQTDVEVATFGVGDFAISDVQLALDVKTAEPGVPFVKGNYQDVPYPLGTFPKDRSVFVYFEIYGLGVSPTGDSLYTVEFLISPRNEAAASWFGSSKGRVTPGVATAYEGSSKSPNVQEYFSLDPSTFTADVYDIRITVRDRVLDREVTREAAFAVDR